MKFGIALAFAAVLSAQSPRLYGPGRVWWDAGQSDILPWDEDYDNPTGQVRILNANGAVHTGGDPFFEALGTNGRACVTCHQPSNAMSVSVASLRERWTETQGKDPIFAAIDGSNCPDLPQSAMSSHSLLLNRGLFRIAIAWPPKSTPDFKIEVVSDPTGCNTSPVYGLANPSPSISVFRRPRIAASLKYIPGVMADAREPSLHDQAITAIMVHEQAKTPPTEQQLRQIIEFESQVYAAQISDVRGGMLNGKTAPSALGPENLAGGKAGTLSASDGTFEVWRKPDGFGLQLEFRASVARGSDLFFARPFQGNQKCATCHAADQTKPIKIDTPKSAELPLFRITCDSGRVIYSQDPGRALITGKCEDTGSILIQQFRGLAARAPYFSNGSAQTLREVVDFYDRKFDIRFTERDKQDLVNFLSVL